ncbi:hypothetical protein [Roseovarius sp.]|uniref:hypothetical protein n=1 Tax=Roseovarius sp. TaxID=1486281 RepID=UPI00356308F1
MSFIRNEEIEDAVKALNRAAFRVGETSSALMEADEKIKQNEQSLKSARESNDSVSIQSEYARTSNLEERITNLQGQLETAQTQREEAARADAEARTALESTRAKAEELLSRLDDALSKVSGNVQKLRGQSGKGADYLRANLQAEQREEAKLRQLRDRLARALETCRAAERPNEGSSWGNGGGLEAIAAGGMGGMGAGGAPPVRHTTYVIEKVHYRRSTYSIEDQLAADPYSRGHPDNQLPPEFTQPWLRQYPAATNYLQAIGGLRYYL